MLSNPLTISEKIENERIGSTELSIHELCRRMCQIRIEKMRSKNKRKETSSLDNISTSSVLGNNHVGNDVNFNMVDPIEEQKGMF